jgi:hypothetical protein
MIENFGLKYISRVVRTNTFFFFFVLDTQLVMLTLSLNSAKRNLLRYFFLSQFNAEWIIFIVLPSSSNNAMLKFFVASALSTSTPKKRAASRAKSPAPRFNTKQPLISETPYQMTATVQLETELADLRTRSSLSARHGVAVVPLVAAIARFDESRCFVVERCCFEFVCVLCYCYHRRCRRRCCCCWCC